MKAEDFQPGFPGQLESTAFESIAAGGTLKRSAGVAFVPDALPPNIERTPILGRLFDVLDRAKTALLRLDGMVDLLPGRTTLLAAIRLREAQASSKIEDTIASMRDVALASLQDESAGQPAAEVYRNRLAIEAGLVSKLPISRRLVREMHSVLVTDPRHRPGTFRDVQVCIGDQARGFSSARFVPPTGARVEGLMAAWELFCNPNTPQAPARARFPYFVELAMAHYQFEAIHPFSDGNGRLGRALVTLAPVKDGQLRHPVCNLSEWVHEHRQDYYDGLLRVSTHGDWEAWIAFFCTALAAQAEADTERAQRLGKLYMKYRDALTAKRQSTTPLKLLDHLFDRQAVTVTSAARAMGVSYVMAKKYVERFESLGIIRGVAKVTYDKPYVAEGVIRALQSDDDD